MIFSNYTYIYIYIHIYILKINIYISNITYNNNIQTKEILIYDKIIISNNLIGRSDVGSHSFLWYAAIGCSDVAIRYFSSVPASPAFSLLLPITCRGRNEFKGQPTTISVKFV